MPTLWKALLLFYGFGNKHAHYACIKLGVKQSTPMTSITVDQLSLLDKNLRKRKFLVEDALKRRIESRIDTLIESRTYRGIRGQQGLPVRGQRTHTNAKTARKMKWKGTAKKLRKNPKKKFDLKERKKKKLKTKK